MLSRFRLRSQAAMVPAREAFCGSTLLTMNTSSRRPAMASADDLLGLAVAIHLGGVDQRHAEVEAELERGDLLGAAARALAHAPCPLAEARHDLASRELERWDA